MLQEVTKHSFFQMHTLFNKQPSFCFGYGMFLTPQNHFPCWGMKCHPKSSALPIRSPECGLLRWVKQPCQYTMPAFRGPGWWGEFNRPQESVWLRNVEILNWLGFFILFWYLQTKTSFRIYWTEPCREILDTVKSHWVHTVQKSNMKIQDKGYLWEGAFGKEKEYST